MTKLKLKPSECEFAIITDYYTITGDGTGCGIFIITADRGHEMADGLEIDEVTAKPAWLPEFEDSEGMWEIPMNVSKEQAIQDMIDLDFVHVPSMGWSMK